MFDGRLTKSADDSVVFEGCEWMSCAVDELQPGLIRYVETFVKDRETARDIVQDSFMKLHQHSDQPTAKGLKPWMYRVCRNAAIDHLRKEKRMTKTEIQESQILAKTKTNPAETIEQQDTFRVVMSEVAMLSSNQQEVLRLKFQSGFSYQEIADVTGLKLSNVGVLLHTAISKLREKLKD